jgi:ABC-type Fe3+/spermidine/putrescine transport system ATPase subunit
MSKITVTSLVKKYNSVVAVDNINLNIAEGEFLTLLGPSGCGKTTTLRCVAGLEHPEQGIINIGDKVVSSSDNKTFLPPDKRDLGMVFQSYAIWPNMTVFDNVAFGLSIRNAPKQEIRDRVEKVLKQVRMEEFASRYATELSGGQQQRVAVARALAFGPRALLFDEPLSNLDAKLREDMRIELVSIQKRIGISSLYVTHDQVEAMAISDRIAIMDKGKIVQVGIPEEIYNKPVNTFVAQFIGTTNLVFGKAVTETISEDSMGTIQFKGEDELVSIRCPFSEAIIKNGKVALSFRPERIKVSPEKTDSENTFNAKVANKLFLGDCVDYYLHVGEYEFRVKADTRLRLDIGKRVYLSIPPEDVVTLPPESE